MYISLTLRDCRSSKFACVCVCEGVLGEVVWCHVGEVGIGMQGGNWIFNLSG